MDEKNIIYQANMTLPIDGKARWTRLMQGNEPLPDRIDPGSPIVQAYAEFEDGTVVIGGVAKSPLPAEYNIKFMWVFDPQNQQQYENWPIDTSDHEDFYHSVYPFNLGSGTEDDHILYVRDADELTQHPPHLLKNQDVNVAQATNMPIIPLVTGMALVGLALFTICKKWCFFSGTVDRQKNKPQGDTILSLCNCWGPPVVHPSLTSLSTHCPNGQLGS